MLDYVLFALLGCFIGVFTGLIPGLHVNTIAVLGLGLYASMGLDPMQFAVLLTALAITHSFLDFIPAIFLGAPEEETALSVLPAHRLFMNGRAFEAVKLTAVGSLLGLGAGLALMIPAFYVIPALYNLSRGFIAYILIIAVILLILHERCARKIKWAALVFLLSGWLGMLILNHQMILSTTEVLFPVFAGLFGLSNLLSSIRSKVPSVPQDEFLKVEIEPKFIGSGFLGALSGALIGILPAISPSQIGVLVSERIKFDVKSFLVYVSAINTSDAIYSMLALYTIKNARSGVAVVVGKILEVDFDTVLLLLGVMAFTAYIATMLHIGIGRRMTRFVEKVSYSKLCAASFVVILILVFVFTGFFGLYLALLSTAIGSLPILSGVSRTHSMGVLLVPTILFFLGMV
ncbi:MAG: tripartite tricarboxylate transporter permease [Candidatus Altiarchaeota archaeon]|nr:tripartite tricarboxylate transporter permease [Candidatus Altiarchaeota archaeon]